MFGTKKGETMQSRKFQAMQSARSTDQHRCNYPGCTKRVGWDVWGCPVHWRLLPKDIRGRIYRTYRPGQDADGDLSHSYIDAQDLAERWAIEYERRKAQKAEGYDVDN